MTSLVTQTATAVVSPVTGWTGVLSVIEVRVTLDESRSPYVQAELLVHTPTDSELLDPRDNLRVTITLGQEWISPARTGQTRTFDLFLHERVIDHEDGTSTVTAYSDEARLIDGGLIANAPDISAVASQSSLRSIINNVVLSKFGTSLSAGSDDADFTVVTEAENLILNPNMEPDSSWWGQVGGTVARDTTWSAFSGASLKLTPSASGSFAFYAPDTANTGNMMTDRVLRTGVSYTLSATGRLASVQTGTLDPAARRIQVYHRIGTGAYTYLQSPAVPNAAGQARVSLTFTLPEGTTEAAIRLWNGSTSTPMWWDAVRLSETDDRLTVDNTQYFDGSTVSPYYTNAWTGAVNASASTRTPKVDRDPEAIVLQPGQSYWDYIQPLFESVGLRLFCDETRTWRLVNAAAYAVAGEVRLAEAQNITRARDTISRQSDQFFDAVVVAYRGSDPVRYDSAGTGGTLVRRIEWDTAFPGFGAAASILERAAGRGRTLDLSALSDLTVTPGMSAVATLPSPTPVQTGAVASVTWSVSADGSTGEMEVATRGLTDTPTTAWALAPASRTWSAAIGTWSTYVN